MTTKFYEIADIIKKETGTNKLPIVTKYLLVPYLIGSIAVLSAVLPIWGNNIYGQTLLICVGFILSVSSLIVDYRYKRKHAYRYWENRKKRISKIKDCLNSSGINSLESISIMQAEIRGYMDSKKEVTDKIISGSKFIFGIIAIGPIGFLFTQVYGVAISQDVVNSVNNPLEITELMRELVYISGLLFVFAIAVVGVYIILYTAIGAIRESVKSSSREEIIYSYLEELKYIIK